MEEGSIEHIWSRIVAWIEDNAPPIFDVLQPGASEAQISELESSLSILLPEDVKSLYHLCNGQSSYRYGVFYEYEFLSLERIKHYWSYWKDLLDAGEFVYYHEGLSDCVDPEICNTWWHPKWIPFTYSGSSDHDCLDLDPTERGTMGQIISMWHDDDQRKVLASGIRAWLQQYAEELESGQFVFVEPWFCIVSVDEQQFQNVGI